MTPVRALSLAAHLATQLAAHWLVAAPALRATLAASPAPVAITILDARDKRDFQRGHIPGAAHIAWKDYRDGWGRTGKLSPDVAGLARKLAELGIDDRHPVIVYGDAREGWGEEGRIAWMLLYLGHQDVRVLDGGYTAWLAAGGVASEGRTTPPAGHFIPRPQPALRASLADVAAAVGIGAPTAAQQQPPVLLDVRPRDEWDGARHYWEPRTGHVPGAVRFEWRDLLDARGQLRDPSVALPLLAARGVTPDRPVIVYCTGGVRSAEALWMLRALGFRDVRNFDGSWYEWAFDKSKPVVTGGADAP